MIDDLCHFLNGRTEPVVSRLQAEMERASDEMRFEQAAVIRDQLRAIENVVARQRVISSEYVDSDVLAMARSDGEACVQVSLFGGKHRAQYFLLEGTEDAPDASVLAEFIKQFYDQALTVPEHVLLPHEVEEAQIITQWLNQKKGDKKVEILVPREGAQQELIEMAAQNATETLAALQAQWQADTHRQERALAELQEALGLPEPPNRIECYDISNTQGTNAVGSMVVFERGVPKKSFYRHFNIRSVVGPDDFASMEEVLMRRFNRWQAAQEVAEAPGKRPDSSFSILPDLVLIDGGKGQLGRAEAVLDRFGLVGKIPVAGLAKQNEELFVPMRKKPIILPRQSQGLYLIQRIRDGSPLCTLRTANCALKKDWLHGWMLSPASDQPGASY
jgi:excinuclease ABC subunit C